MLLQNFIETSNLASYQNSKKKKKKKDPLHRIKTLLRQVI